MTTISGAGALLRYTFDDSSSFHVRLSDVFSEEMRLFLERLQDLHGRIVRISIFAHSRSYIPRGSDIFTLRRHRGSPIKPGESKPE